MFDCKSVLFPSNTNRIKPQITLQLFLYFLGKTGYSQEDPLETLTHMHIEWSESKNNIWVKKDKKYLFYLVSKFKFEIQFCEWNLSKTWLARLCSCENEYNDFICFDCKTLSGMIWMFKITGMLWSWFFINSVDKCDPLVDTKSGAPERAFKIPSSWKILFGYFLGLNLLISFINYFCLLNKIISSNYSVVRTALTTKIAKKYHQVCKTDSFPFIKKRESS